MITNVEIARECGATDRHYSGRTPESVLFFTYDILDAFVERIQREYAENQSVEKVADIRKHMCDVIETMKNHETDIVGWITTGDLPHNDPPPLPTKGYVLVPLVPTTEMVEAGEAVEDLYKRGTPSTWIRVYRAMIGAAPLPTEQLND